MLIMSKKHHILMMINVALYLYLWVMSVSK
jgi:hypothetical protein